MTKLHWREEPAPYKVITCVLPAGRAYPVLDALRTEKGISSAYAHHARGTGMAPRKARTGALPYLEREILTALVPVERADEIFEFLYVRAGIDEPHAGMVLMEKARRGEPFILPEEE